MGGMSSSVVVGQPRLFFLAAAIATAGSILMSAPIRGQEQTVATPADTIMARKTVMDTLSDKMDAIELMISSNKIDLKTGQDGANDISVYLMAFPLLFPGDQSVEAECHARSDRRYILIARRMDQVRRLLSAGTAASKAAFTASRAQNDADFKAADHAVAYSCNACHGPI